MKTIQLAAGEGVRRRTGRFAGLRASGFLALVGGPRRFLMGGLPSFSSRNSSSSGQETGILFLR